MSDALPVQPPAYSLLDPHLDDEESKGRIRRSNEELILAAAERAFSRSGFKGTTMAQIADQAQLPKANLHYYFGNKENLYLHVLDRILHDWLSPLDAITPEADPKQALASYIQQKMRLTYERPEASRLFANELLQGANVIGGLLQTELKELVQTKAAVVDGWIAAGKVAPLDSTHLFFSIWSLTQSYADFDIQIRAVLGRSGQSQSDRQRAERHVLTLIFRTCGLA
ncbi:TetR/AcrR family transcriptional regulator [Pseudaeromonas sp. ZJS20]|uniref:TetR/AcrR family transcriptional regulator n=1 Tax=Pseudaeromonas aegiceratis TaxID=3153928 RepID=UPI00390C81C5